MFRITELNGNLTERLVDTAETFEAAKAKLEAMGVVYMEDDADYPGCADAFMKSGICLHIQPEGFKL